MRRTTLVAMMLVVVACQPATEKIAPQVDDGIFRAAVIGDSVAHGAGDEAGRGIAGWLDAELSRLRLPFAPTRNLGIDGARTGVVLKHLGATDVRAAIRSADAVIVSIGGNDLYGDSIARLASLLWPERAMERTLSRVDQIVTRIHPVNPTTHIYLLGLYDPYRRAFLARQVNLWDARLIARFAGDRKLTVIRIADVLDDADRLSPIDHFHPGSSGYAAIAGRVVGGLDIVKR